MARDLQIPASGQPETSLSPAADSLRGDVERFLTADSFAVVGASDRRGVHQATIANLLRDGAKAWGVHPTRSEVRGLPCVSSCEKLPETPDVAILLVGHERVLDAAEEVLAAGARALVAPGLGHEAGAARRETAAALARLAERHGVPLLGPNCMGAVIPDGTSAWVGTLGRHLLHGKVAAVVQSGAIGEALTSLGPRVGFRCIISTGAEISRDVADFCSVLAADEETAVVGLFLEAVRRPKALRTAFEQLAVAGKPVVCLRVGKSVPGARATAAHSDAILTPERAFAALARYANLIEVEDFAEFVEALEILGHRRRPRGLRMAAITQSGGQAALLADLAADAGADLSEFSPPTTDALAASLPEQMPIANPLDAWSIDETIETYRRVFEVIATSGEFDAMVVQWDQSPFIGEMESAVAERTIRALVRAPGETCPVIVSGQASEPLEAVAEMARRHDIPLLRGVRPAIRALAGVGAWRPREVEAALEEPEPLALPDERLGELEATALLAENGIPFARLRRVGSEGDALAAARDLGYPVVMKAVGPAHRSDLGLVRVGVSDEEQVCAAIRSLGLPVLIAEQVPGGEEFYAGGKQDPEYGPIVCFGRAGDDVEKGGEVLGTLAPLTTSSAAELISGMGKRGGLAPRSATELAEVLVEFSRFLTRLPLGTAVDLNLIVNESGRSVLGVDALVVHRSPRYADG